MQGVETGWWEAQEQLFLCYQELLIVFPRWWG